ncbi:MAG: hypothetical protein EZS28_031633 [Streblomastix strix]|uniref:Uncharacterized protein n=1 Tax=Streblomastix strix TaxID=222440 RepID=A0A5J4URV8_9EUKA|nr:MAG: hypothetical protein EZS28_031633 [Streblomastix strix]
MTSHQEKLIEQEIRRIDPQISAADAHAGRFAINNPAARRRIYTKGFPQCLLQELYETNIRVNNEGKLIESNHMENTQRYEQNINARIDQLSIYQRSRGPVVTEEEQMNELLNFGSQQQKKKVSNQLQKEFPSNNEQDLGQQAIFADIPPEQTIAQQFFTYRER